MEQESPTTVVAPQEQPAPTSAFGPAPTATPPPPAETYLPPVSSAPAQKQGWKTWLAGGLAAAVFGVGGFFGIQAVTHHSGNTATTAAANGTAGRGFPGAGGGPGGAGGGFGGGAGRGAFGTIKSINGSSLTLSTF